MAVSLLPDRDEARRGYPVRRGDCTAILYARGLFTMSLFMMTVTEYPRPERPYKPLPKQPAVSPFEMMDLPRPFALALVPISADTKGDPAPETRERPPVQGAQISVAIPVAIFDG